MRGYRLWKDKKMYMLTAINWSDILLYEVVGYDDDETEWTMTCNEEDILMQSTGLYDINDKMIYEEDMVAFYCDGVDRFFVEPVQYEEGNYMVGDYTLGGIYNECMVVGNIYEGLRRK